MLVIVLMSWDLLFSDHGYFVYQAEHQQVKDLQTDIEKLHVAKKKLIAEIVRLREDPKALEEVIHRELGYVYPDEYMLIMPKTNVEEKKRIENE